MLLSDVPFEKLSKKQRVRSLLTGVLGTIVELVPRERATRKEDNEIVIAWDNGKESEGWHFQFDKVELV